MLDGFLGFSWLQCVITVLILTHITIASVTMYLHRSQAHRSVDFHPIVSHFFRLWLWLTTGMKTKDWVSIHRKHHAKCETKEDPHSPQVLGLKKVLWEGAELYKAEAANSDTLTRYGHGTPSDWLERHIYQHSWAGISLMFLIDIMLFGLKGISVWGIQMLWIPFFAAGVINGVGHAIGYRNFESPDASTNLGPIGLLIGGEELHNNHHTYPTSARLSIKWYEFDIGWIYIRLLSFFKLATVRRVAPTVALTDAKTLCESTLKSLLANRFDVMTVYTKTVLKPAFEKAQANASASQQTVLKQLKSSWGRITDVDPHALKAFPQLMTAVQLKQNLQSIWDNRTASTQELLTALSGWCEQARQARLQATESFIDYISRYHLKTA
jgi:stearoyl-CoA desaturase (delta-9 desaturase)